MNMIIIIIAGMILFWPVLFFHGGTKKQEAEYLRTNSEYEALDIVAEQKILYCLLKLFIRNLN